MFKGLMTVIRAVIVTSRSKTEEGGGVLSMDITEVKREFGEEVHHGIKEEIVPAGV